MNSIPWKSLVPEGDVFHLARYHYHQRGKGSGHTHTFAEIFWFEEGVGWQMLNGRKRRVGKGDLFILRPQDGHILWTQDEDAFTIVNLMLPTKDVSRLARTYGAAIRQYWPVSGPACYVRLNETQLSAIKDMAEELASAARTRMVLDRFLLNFFNVINPGIPVDMATPVPDWLVRACRAIRQPEHFRQGTRGFARLCCRCPEYVARATRKHLGRSPSEIVNAARLDHASRQLLMTEVDVLEISLNCGYESLSYFYKLFKRRFKVSPRQYRYNKVHKEIEMGRR